MTRKCPYCEKEAKPRGLKNHIRLSSGSGHGEKGSLPDGYESDLEAATSGGEPPQSDTSETTQTEPDGESEPPTSESGAAEVTADTLGDTEPDVEPESESDSLPFNPEADGAIELDGGETVTLRHNGEIKTVEAEPGDWLLITPDGPVLYDPDTDSRYEVVTE